MAIRDFRQWFALSVFDLPLVPGGSAPHKKLFSTEALSHEALAQLYRGLGCNISLQNLVQHAIAKEFNATVLKTVFSNFHGLFAITEHTQPGIDLTSGIHLEHAPTQQ